MGVEMEDHLTHCDAARLGEWTPIDDRRGTRNEKVIGSIPIGGSTQRGGGGNPPMRLLRHRSLPPATALLRTRVVPG
jgi:hypothetical protein